MNEETSAPPLSMMMSGRAAVLPPIVPRKSLKPVKFPPPEALLSQTSSSERRASFLRNVSKASSTSGGGVSRRTSITPAELQILGAIAAAGEEDDDKDEVVDSEGDAARNRLRRSIKLKSALLTASETNFLTKLVDSAPCEQLEAAADVLANDPLYKPPKARRHVSIVISGDYEDEEGSEGKEKPSRQRDASFRKELWEDYWEESSSLGRLSDHQAPASNSPSHKTLDSPSPSKEEKKPRNLVYFFQRALLMIDSDDEQSDHVPDESTNTDDDFDNISFWVLGTTETDEDVHPMVLSPSMMDALRPHMPYACQQDNYWLKYSMIRDGASLRSLIQCVRHSARTILAIETFDGDVFGSFTSSPWRINGDNYYGSGESFIWRLCKSRYTPCRTVEEQKILESKIDVFGWSGKNRNVQLLPSFESDLAIGGGSPDDDDSLSAHAVMTDRDGVVHSSKEWGFALTLSNDLTSGTSQFSVTFENPSLPTTQKEVFEVANIEIWTMTPVDNEEQAKALELSRQFIFDHGHFVEA